MPSQGYASLLTPRGDPHWVLFLFDFAFERRLEERLRSQFPGRPYRLLFMEIEPTAVDYVSILSFLISEGLDPTGSHVSVQLFHCTYEGYEAGATIARMFKKYDLCRVELPLTQMGFRSEHASATAEIICQSNYIAQDQAAGLFYSHLSAQVPYRVDLITEGEHRLFVIDTEPWVQIAGPVEPREWRLLPGGEVAYTGERVEGLFTVDGAILPTPQSTAAAPLARAIFELSRHVAHDPITLEIRGGQVVEWRSARGLARQLQGLLKADGFRQLTEVGVSFNQACRDFTHEWPCPANESHPGVHIGIGGEPAPSKGGAPDPMAMVHIDLIASTGSVLVNDRNFMTRGHVDGL